MSGLVLALAAALQEPQETEAVVLRRAVDCYEADTPEDYRTAYSEFEVFVLSYPTSARASEAKRYMMECGKRLVLLGYTEKVLGLRIPFLKSRKVGVELLRDALARFPREPFAGDYRLWLAEYFFEKDEWDEARLEFQAITEIHTGSPHGPRALFRLGEVGMLRFHGVDYDMAPLEEAKGHFERLVREYPQNPLAAEGRARLGTIQELLAQKWFIQAEFYRRRGLPQSAAFMYRVVREQYPDTTWAGAAAERLRGMGE